MEKLLNQICAVSSDPQTAHIPNQKPQEPSLKKLITFYLIFYFLFWKYIFSILKLNSIFYMFPLWIQFHLNFIYVPF